MFNISDVANLLGIKRLTEGNSFNVVCPFCGDTRGKMNFRIVKDGELANTYHCFKCGAHGNMLTLYADLMGICGVDRYKIAYREIKTALHEGAGCRNSYDSSFTGMVTQIEEEETASLEKRSQIYQRLIEMLSLSETHRRKLMDRGLTSNQIEAFHFRSTPVHGTEGLARRLIKEGYSLAGIPGFYMNQNQNWDIALYRNNQGILCPAYSISGKIEGFQIRLDVPHDDKKYLWLSSTNKKRGAGSKSPVSFVGNPFDKTVRVTEGILKPIVAHALSGYSFLGTPGVNQYKSLEKALAVLKENGLEMVMEYFDMDKFMDIGCYGDYKSSTCGKCQNKERYYGRKICEEKRKKRDQIRAGCCRLYESCDRLNLKCIRKTWDQREDGIWAGNDKGIDDYWWSGLKKKEEQIGYDGMDRTIHHRSNLPSYGTRVA